MSSTEILELSKFENNLEPILKYKDANMSLLFGGAEILKDIRIKWLKDLYYLRFSISNFGLEDKAERTFRNQAYKPLQESSWICGLLKEESPETIEELERIAKEERLTIAVDAGILIRNLLSRQILPLLGEVKWIQTVIPSCALWELENKADQDYPESGDGYLGLQEVVRLKRILPTFIVGDKPEIMLPTRIQDKTNIMRDHIICRQIKDFMKKSEIFKHVYFITIDKTAASIGRIMDMESLYIPHPEITKINEEYELKSVSYSILQNGWTYTPLTRFLWVLAHKFSEIIIKTDEELEIRVMGDYPGKLPNDWIDGRVMVEVLENEKT